MRKQPSARQVAGWAPPSGPSRAWTPGSSARPRWRRNSPEADALLAAELGITGQALTELAARADEIGAAFGSADQALARRAGATR